MKFEVQKTKIEPIIQKVARLAGKHATLPVLTCIYMEANKDGSLILKTTNLDIGMELITKVKISNPGITAVPAQVLVNTLATIKDDVVTMELVDNNLKLTSSRNSVVIKCLAYEDFPSIPRITTDKKIKVAAHDLINGFRSVWYSASISFVKPELSSVYVYKNDETLVFVSTDSFRLAEKRIHTTSSIEFPNTLIPYKNVSEMIRVFEDYKGDIEIMFDKNQASFSSPEVYLVSRLIDGTFPDYKQIIPKSPIAQVTVLKNDFANGIKASNVFSDALHQVRLKVNTKSHTLDIESKNNDVGEYKEAVKADLTGEDVELNFNNKYISDCFQSIFSDSISLGFGGIGKPLIIQGNNDKSFLYIVMPMNR